MTSRRVALLLAGSIFLTGATGAYVGSITSAQAITSVDELTDVNQNHWAYDALRDLVEKYDVIEGYPNHTFRGNRTATRWEMAAALNALIKSVGRDLARLGAEKADKADLETLARLQDEFKNELSALQARTNALESRAAAIEAKNEEQDQRLSLLERTQLHGDMSFGVLSDMSGKGTSLGNTQGRNGIRDGISAIGRLRLAMDIPVKEDKEDSKVGAGEVHTRMIAAFGRIAPGGAQQNNACAFNPFNGYSRIASDSASGNEGLGASTLGNSLKTGTNLRSYLYLEDVHYHQHFKSGIPLLTDFTMGACSTDKNWATTGDLYMGSMPWRYLYDKSPFRGNENTQFQNTAFVNTPGIAVNQNYPMIAYQWHQQLGAEDRSFDLTSGIGAMDVGNALNALNLTYEGRFNYKFFNVPGSLYAGGYNIWSAGNRNATTGYFNNAGFGSVGSVPVNQSGLVTGGSTNSTSTNAVYGGWNQEWYKGIGTTINYFLSNNTRNNYFFNSNNQMIGAIASTSISSSGVMTPIAIAPRQSASGVLSVPMNIFGVRNNDVFGVGYSALEFYGNGLAPNPANGTRLRSTWEQVVEAYYKWSINDAISVIPSVQIITGSLGVRQNNINTVVGLRTSYSF